MRYFIVVISTIFLVQTVEAKVSEDSVFTLYRNNHLNPFIRVHIATFDSTNGERFNSFNCQKAMSYFQKAAIERTSKAKIWCEKGYFRE